MPLVLKWQGYRDLRVLCKLYSKDSRYSEYASHCVKSVQIRIFFSVSYFPVFGLNTETYGVNLRIQSEYRKIRPEKTPYLDIFHTVPGSQYAKILYVPAILIY